MSDTKEKKMKPRVFVGSSVEALDIAYAFQQELEYEAEVTVWAQGIFELSSNALDDLLATLQQSDFGIFIFSPDDIVTIRKEQRKAVRDNVVFELGLFTGRLGKQRTFIIIPRGYEDFHLPSDLTGVTPATFDSHRQDGNLRAALGPSSHDIKKRMRKLGRFDALSGQVITPENPKDAVLRGAKLAESFIGKSYGPHGKYMLISSSEGQQLHFKRGVNIASNIHSDDMNESKGIGLMAKVADEAYKLAGDFSKTAVLLAQAMVENGHAAIARGLLPKDVVRGMQTGIKSVYKHIEETSGHTSKEDLFKIAKTAAGGDENVAQIVTEAISKVGNNGRVSVLDSDSSETHLIIREGWWFTSGYLSPEFVTEDERDECILEDCRILLCDWRISSMSELLPILEQIVQLGSPLLVIAENVEGEALATLIVNKNRGSIKCAAVRFPAPNQSRKEYLEDIAVITGAKVISSDLGISLSGVQINDLGQAKKVIVSRETTTIIEGNGTQEAIAARVSRIKAIMHHSTSSIEQDALQDRLVKIAGAVAVIYAGGTTEIDVIDQKYKIVSALNSANTSISEGWLPGGGKSLLEAKKVVTLLTSNDEAEQAGLQVISQALEQPIRRLIESVYPAKGQEILDQVIQSPSGRIGFNVETRRIEDLVDANVLDSAKAVHASLDVAFSQAKIILQTGAWDLNDRQTGNTSNRNFEDNNSVLN